MRVDLQFRAKSVKVEPHPNEKDVVMVSVDSAELRDILLEMSIQDVIDSVDKDALIETFMGVGRREGE